MYKLSDLVQDLKMSMHAQQTELTDYKAGEDIIRMVCMALEVNVSDVKSQSRNRELADARHIICYILRRHTTLSARQIGNKLGGRDHSTVLGSVITCQEFIDSHNKDFLKKIEAVNSYLSQDLCI